MKEKLRIGIVGCGQFARNFVPLFKEHPVVEYVAVCDIFRERAEKFQSRYGTDKIYDSFDEMVESSDLNAIAIFSQRDTHGWMAISALASPFMPCI